MLSLSFAGSFVLRATTFVFVCFRFLSLSCSVSCPFLFAVTSFVYDDGGGGGGGDDDDDDDDNDDASFSL